MKVRVTPGGVLGGEVSVPGDKSIAHRWLLLAATAMGRSSFSGVPRSLDTASTASSLSALVPAARPALEAWGSSPSAIAEANGSTWNREPSTLDLEVLEVQGEGRGSLRPAERDLDCGNSGTSMRLLAGLVASAPFVTVLRGDASLSSRPMERVAAPLRAMGADVHTEHGHAPLTIRGADLSGIDFQAEVPSAQVKGAVLLAGLAADGRTSVVEPVRTRDHTERALAALGAPVQETDLGVALDGPFQHEGFRGRVPGDPSSAAFVLGAAAITGGEVILTGVGLNPSRLGYVDVLRRMGLDVEAAAETDELGEPVGTIRLRGPRGGLTARDLRPVRVRADELPRVIDEIPLLAALATHAVGPSRFEGASELRVKESDRLSALVDGIRGLGGIVEAQGDDLEVAGGGLAGGMAGSTGDHRIAMALTVAALAADGPSEVRGLEWAAVSFPGFLGLLRALGATVEEAA
jgi:3-phosphoshikimate 1-carboxyvinyltransferase